MKKIIAALMALIMLCSFFCANAEEMSIVDQAKNIISAINYFVKENSNVDQLFVGFQEMAEGQVYGFYTADNTLQALLVGNNVKNDIDSCSFVCDDPDVMALALNCASLLPFAQLLAGEDDSIAEAMQDDMYAMAQWLDENHLDALEAFENKRLFTLSYSESEFFHLDLMIVPLNDGARLMATYYFRPADAE